MTMAQSCGGRFVCRGASAAVEPPHHRPHHDRQKPAAAQPTWLHQFLRGGNPCLEADHTWCPGGAASWHAAKLRLTHVFFPLGFIALYRQRLFVEHDLGGSLGSAVDAAPSWVSMG